jgi:hypothetical protein
MMLVPGAPALRRMSWLGMIPAFISGSFGLLLTMHFFVRHASKPEPTGFRMFGAQLTKRRALKVH